MAEHVALKKEFGESDPGLGSARYAGPDRGFCPALVGKDREQRQDETDYFRLADNSLRIRRTVSPRMLDV
jgi:hypothetical protein